MIKLFIAGIGGAVIWHAYTTGSDAIAIIGLGIAALAAVAQYLEI